MIKVSVVSRRGETGGGKGLAAKVMKPFGKLANITVWRNGRNGVGPHSGSGVKWFY